MGNAYKARETIRRYKEDIQIMFVGRLLVYVCHINPNESSTISGEQRGGKRQKKAMKEERSMVMHACF